MKQQDKLTLSAVVFIFSMSASINTQADVIGKIIFATGKCYAENDRSERRKIRRSSKVKEGDTIYTQDASKVQLRFVDGAVISLAENTTFKVNEYEYSATENTSNLELIKGGLRAITGKITSKDSYEYKVKTPLASLKAEDAYWSAELVPAGGSPRANLNESWSQQPTLYGAPGRDNLKMELVTAVWQGEVNGVTNTGQQFSLGPSEPTNFGKIGQDNQFVALLEQPDSVAMRTDRKPAERLAEQQPGDGPAEPGQPGKKPGKHIPLSPLAPQQLAQIGPKPKPLIDKFGDVFGGGGSNTLPQSKLQGAALYGVLTDPTQAFKGFHGGIANIINRASGDAAIGNNFITPLVTKSITKDAGTFTPFSAGLSSGGDFNWDIDPGIGLLYGKWDNPTFITSSGTSTVNHIYFAIVNPMTIAAHSFTGQTFSNEDFKHDSTNIASSSFSVQLSYNHTNEHVTINDFDYTVNLSNGITYTDSNLSRGPVFGAAFVFDNPGTASNADPYNAVLNASLTGRVIALDDISETGLVGAFNIHNHNNQTNNAQVLFGLSD